MISLTDKAVQKLKEFVEPWEIVRLAVEGGGCNGCLLYTSDAADE